jgi:hypothetical protein
MIGDHGLQVLVSELVLLVSLAKLGLKVTLLSGELFDLSVEAPKVLVSARELPLKFCLLLLVKL